MVGKWICGMSMRIHAMNRVCHNPYSFISLFHVTWEVESHIVCILKPSTMKYNTLDANEGILMGAKFLETILIIHIFVMKSIPLSFRFAFS